MRQDEAAASSLDFEGAFRLYRITEELFQSYAYDSRQATSDIIFICHISYFKVLRTFKNEVASAQRSHGQAKN